MYIYISTCEFPVDICLHPSLNFRYQLRLFELQLGTDDNSTSQFRLYSQRRARDRARAHREPNIATRHVISNCLKPSALAHRKSRIFNRLIGASAIPILAPLRVFKTQLTQAIRTSIVHKAAGFFPFGGGANTPTGCSRVASRDS